MYSRLKRNKKGFHQHCIIFEWETDQICFKLPKYKLEARGRVKTLGILNVIIKCFSYLKWQFYIRCIFRIFNSRNNYTNF